MSFAPLHTLSPSTLQSIRLIATDMDGTLTRGGKFTADLLRSLNALADIGLPVLIVTGRSAGWVNGVVAYLPVAGAIAENGGLYDPGDTELELLVPIASVSTHRHKLAQMFAGLQQEFPQIQEATDNQFRLTDWTFGVAGLSLAALQTMGDRCLTQGWGFTYSTVQCHIKPLEQDKSAALLRVLQTHFPGITPDQILTIGDSPNDESLFNGDRFPHSIGVANVLHYRDRLTYQPTYVTTTAEVDGFCEVTRLLCHHRHPSELVV